MDINLPVPLAIYFAAENQGHTEIVAQCFALDAVVQDEGKTIKGLAAIKQWETETRKKYQHTIEPLAFAQKDGKAIVTNRLTGNFPAARSSWILSLRSPATKSRRWRSSHE